MESLKYLPRYTASDYQLWEGEWELIDGRAVSMSPSPVRKHQQLGTVFLHHIYEELTKNKDNCGNCEVVFELDWIVNENTVLRPDISVICDEANDFITKAPVLIIEIISPSTALKDKHIKYEIYQAQGVKYYIIADASAKTCQVYSLVDGIYQTYSSLSFDIHHSCALHLDLPAIVAAIK